MGRLSLKWVEGNTNSITPDVAADTTFNVDDPTMWTPLSVLSGLASGFCERRAVLSNTFQTGPNTSRVWSQTGTSATEVEDRDTIVQNCMHNLATGAPLAKLFYDGATATMMPIGEATPQDPTVSTNYMIAMDSAISSLISGTSKYVKSGTADTYSFSDLASAASSTASATASASSVPLSAIDMPQNGGGATLRGKGLPGIPVEWAKERKWMLDELKHTEATGAADDQITISQHVAKHILSNSETSGTTYKQLQTIYTSAIAGASVSSGLNDNNKCIAYVSGQPKTSALRGVNVAYYTKIACEDGWHTAAIEAGGYVYNRDSSLDTPNRNGWSNEDATPTSVYTIANYGEVVISEYAYPDPNDTENYYEVTSVTRALDKPTARANIYLERAPNNLGDGEMTIPVTDYARYEYSDPIVYVKSSSLIISEGLNNSYSVASGGTVILAQGGSIPFLDIQSGGSVIFSGGSVTTFNIMDGGYMQPKAVNAGAVTFSGLYPSNGYSLNYKQSSGWGYLPDETYSSLTIVSSVISDTSVKDVYVTSGGKITINATRDIYCVVCSGGSVSVNASTTPNGVAGFVSSGGILRVGGSCKPRLINILSGGTVFFDDDIDYYAWYHCHVYIHSGGSLFITGKAIPSNNPQMYWDIEEGAYINIASDADWNKITYNHPESGALTFITPYDAQYIADICSSAGALPGSALDRFLGDVTVARFNPFNLYYTAGGSSVYLTPGWNEIPITDILPYDSTTDDEATAYALLAGTTNVASGRSNASTTVLAPATVQSNGMLYFTSYGITNAYAAVNSGSGSVTTLQGLYACTDCDFTNAVRVYAINYPLGATTKNHYQEFYVRQFP